MNSNKLSKVGRKKSHRDSLALNLLNDLIVYEYMTTTKAKSALVLGEFDRVINLAKGDKSAFEKKRFLTEMLGNENSVAKLLDVYTKRFKDEKSGLVKVYKVGNRKGDNAEMVKLIVKGYTYKEVGKKVSDKPAKKEAKATAKAEEKASGIPAASKMANQKSQLAGNANAAKTKTRSGI